MARKLDDEVDMENDLLDLSKETTHAEKVELLGRLLDSESTLFSKKMRDWLVKDGTLSRMLAPALLLRIPPPPFPSLSPPHRDRPLLFGCVAFPFSL
jgi:hypothetical protein